MFLTSLASFQPAFLPHLVTTAPARLSVLAPTLLAYGGALSFSALFLAPCPASLAREYQAVLLRIAHPRYLLTQLARYQAYGRQRTRCCDEHRCIVAACFSSKRQLVASAWSQWNMYAFWEHGSPRLQDATAKTWHCIRSAPYAAPVRAAQKRLLSGLCEGSFVGAFTDSAIACLATSSPW